MMPTGDFRRLHPVLAGVVQVQVHLARIGVGEAAELEIEYDEAPQSAVKEEQVDAIPVVVDSQRRCRR